MLKGKEKLCDLKPTVTMLQKAKLNNKMSKPHLMGFSFLVQPSKSALFSSSHAEAKGRTFSFNEGRDRNKKAAVRIY